MSRIYVTNLRKYTTFLKNMFRQFLSSSGLIYTTLILCMFFKYIVYFLKCYYYFAKQRCTAQSDCREDQCCLLNKRCSPKLPKYFTCYLTVSSRITVYIISCRPVVIKAITLVWYYRQSCYHYPYFCCYPFDRNYYY